MMNEKMQALDKKIENNLLKIKNIVVVMSGKGGVGKTTVTTNIAFGLSQKGYKTGILDADLHGPNIPIMFGVHGQKPLNGNEPYRINKNLSLVSLSFFSQDQDSPAIWRGPAKIGVIKQLLGDISWGELDFLIVDLPPGTGDEPLTIAQTISDIDGCIIVSTPQQVSLADTRKSINFAKILKMNIIGLVENMSGFVCPACNKLTNIFSSGGGETTSKEFKIDFLGKIPLDPQITKASDQGNPEINFEKGKYFKEIVTKIENKIAIINSHKIKK